MPTIDADADFPETREKWELATFPERLRHAVRRAGGGKEISRISGVAYGTLNGYIGGSEPKWTNLVRIAAACGVSLDWLATGKEAPKPDAPAAAAPPAAPTPNTTPGPLRLFSAVNIDLLAAAMEAADAALHQANPYSKNWRRRAQLTTVLYDEAAERINENPD